VASNAETIATETAIWLARLERGLQADEGSQLRIWLRQPAHRDAIVEAAKLWHGPDIVAVLAELVPVGFGQAPPPPIKVKRRYPPAILVAVCVGGLVAVMPFVAIYHHMPGVITRNYRAAPALPWGTSAYSTKPGETRAVTLPDGSRITLNGQTRLSVAFGAGWRVASLDYGEAIFRISPEPQRPFEVNAGGRHFQAPPSMFDVQVINPQAVELMVLRGGVTVKGLPWHWPSTPAEARLFDPDAFVDTTIGPLQAARLEDQTISRYAITAANARARLQWEPEQVIYVTP
jgi:transmembrane sensor